MNKCTDCKREHIKSKETHYLCGACIDNDHYEYYPFKSQAEYLLSRIKDKVGGVMKFGKRQGAPHLVIDNMWSIVWFAKTQTFNIYGNYASPHNYVFRRDIKNWSSVTNIINRLLDEPKLAPTL